LISALKSPARKRAMRNPRIMEKKIAEIKTNHQNQHGFVVRFYGSFRIHPQFFNLFSMCRRTYQFEAYYITSDLF